MPRRRILTDRCIQEAMAAAGRCRAACVRIRTEAPIGGPAYQAAAAVMAAVDDLAELLTDDRRHFHTKPHTSVASAEVVEIPAWSGV